MANAQIGKTPIKENRGSRPQIAGVKSLRAEKIRARYLQNVSRPSFDMRKESTEGRYVMKPAAGIDSNALQVQQAAYEQLLKERRVELLKKRKLTGLTDGEQAELEDVRLRLNELLTPPQARAASEAFAKKLLKMGEDLRRSALERASIEAALKAGQ